MILTAVVRQSCKLFPLVPRVYNPFLFWYSHCNRWNLLLKEALPSINRTAESGPFIWVVILALLSLELMGELISKDNKAFFILQHSNSTRSM